MAARRRSSKTNDLPPNLYCRNGYYSFRDPRTGKEYGLGRDKRYAVTEAIDANMKMIDPRPMSLAQRMSGEGDMTLHRWLERYEKLIEGRNLKPKTISDYSDRIRAVRSGMNDVRLTDMSTRIVADFISGYEERGKKTTAKLLRSTLLDLFRSAIEEGYMKDNPALATRNPRAKVMRSRLSVEDCKAIIKQAEAFPSWVSSSIRLALLTGQRVGDISKMQWTDVVDGFLRVEQEKTRAKLAIPLTISLDFLSGDLSSLLDEIRVGRKDDFIISSRRGEKVSPRTISAKFSEARTLTGITWQGTPPSFHELRSLSARLHAKGKDPEYAQKLLGHKSSIMTDRYRDSRGSEWNVISS